MIKHGYDPKTVEPKWQEIWDEKHAFRTETDIEELKKKPKYYVLDMFPYPSGAGLHVGHPEGYTATDIIARKRRMQGYNVLHPMGWDAFGLPAERAAVRENLHPAVITKRNVDTFKRQIKRLGFSYDWDREINSSAADYYKWTQWIFLKLFEKDLAYMADVPVNWCPALGTVLSNEEVKDGKYVETGDPVEKRLMRQWMLKITAYAERLIEDLDLLDWPDSLKEMQRNWIGKSIGANITFAIDGGDHAFTAFTTRPDTLFGATYCVLAPEHGLIEQITTAAQKAAVTAYVDEAKQKSDLQRTDLAKSKTGVFTGAYAINPANDQKIPIWVADYVLISYGTGAIMAVPGQDERDWEFAEQFDLPIIRTVQPPAGFDGKAYTGEGVAMNSGFLDGLNVDDAKAKMIAWLEEQGTGESEVQYRLRDWLFSRQRYWGEPFPIIHFEDGSIMPVAEADLPLELPSIDEYRPTDDGRPPLARAGDDWLMVTMPDGRVGMRETNTMPQWAGSCWYYLRYIDANNSEAAWAKELEEYWMPVDLYVGGAEHAVLHLLYARFWHKVLYDCGLVSTKEPFQKLFNQGMILAYSYRDERGKYYHPDEVEQRDDDWFVKESDTLLETQIEKMSKSRYNVVNPDDVIDEYGADSMRLYEMFIGPLSASVPWQMAGLEGVFRFLQKSWRLVIDENTGELSGKLVDAPAGSEPALQKVLHKTIMGVDNDIETIDKMNTAISKMMVFVNAAAQAKTLPRAIISDFICLLAPFAPHLAEELWERFGGEGLVAHAAWPVYDAALTVDSVIKVPVQVNGKVRAVLEVSADIEEEALRSMALAEENVGRHLDGKEIRRVIVIKKKLINIVVS